MLSRLIKSPGLAETSLKLYTLKSNWHHTFSYHGSKSYYNTCTIRVITYSHNTPLVLSHLPWENPDENLSFFIQPKQVA